MQNRSLDYGCRLVRSGHMCGEWLLYETLAPGVSFLLSRNLGRQAGPDEVDCVLARLVEQIKNGAVGDEPGVKSELRRLVCESMDQNRQHRKVPAEQVQASEPHTPRVRSLQAALRNCTRQERSALVRFYVQGESPENIEDSLGIERGGLRRIRSRIRQAVSVEPARATREARHTEAFLRYSKLRVSRESANDTY